MAKKPKSVDMEEFGDDLKEQGFTDDFTKKVVPYAEEIEPGQEELTSEDIIYIAVMTDDSDSIAHNESGRDNTQDVIDGHNDIVKALEKATTADNMLFKTQLLNSKTALNNWVKLKDVTKLTTENFKPRGTTPLYDRTLALLRSVVYERNEALKAGHSNVRWGILLITDGKDVGSTSTASEVKILLDEMKKKGELLENCEPNNKTAGSIALMGVEDRKSKPETAPDFETIARSMGIGWILHADRADDRDMRRAFNAFSKGLLSAAP